MKNNRKTGVSIWKWLKITAKWLWLMAMFVLGILAYVLLPLDMFEYSYSLSELDLVETAFIVLLMMFVYRYTKLCRRTKAPLIRKIITPWVHQAHLMLVCIIPVVIADQFFEFNVDDFEKMPLMDFVSYGLMSVTLLCSYKQMNKYPSKSLKVAEAVDKEGVVE